MAQIITFRNRSSSNNEDEVEQWFKNNLNMGIKAVSHHTIGGKLNTWIFFD